jgi:tetratricopeptide (TPR) repeat protein
MTALYGNDVDAALKFFEKAVSINPKNSEAFLFLCQVYSSQKNDAKALEAALKARRLSPYGYSEGINLGTVYSRLGMARESAAEYLDLIRLYPERSMAYYNLAEIFYSAGDRERALFYVEGALRSDPGMKAAIDLYNALKK